MRRAIAASYGRRDGYAVDETSEILPARALAPGDRIAVSFDAVTVVAATDALGYLVSHVPLIIPRI
jgi:hypothetical protein